MPGGQARNPCTRTITCLGTVVAFPAWIDVHGFRVRRYATPRNDENGLWTHAEFALARLEHPRREAGEVDRQPPRVARVDDLLDPESLRRAERRAQLLQPFVDLGDLGLAVGRGVDLCAVGGLDPAFERQR